MLCPYIYCLCLFKFKQYLLIRNQLYFFLFFLTKWSWNDLSRFVTYCLVRMSWCLLTLEVHSHQLLGLQKTLVYLSLCTNDGFELSGLHLSTYKGAEVLMAWRHAHVSLQLHQMFLHIKAPSGIHILLNHRFLLVGLYPFHCLPMLNNAWDSSVPIFLWCGAPSDPRVQWLDMFLSLRTMVLHFSHRTNSFSNRSSFGGCWVHVPYCQCFLVQEHGQLSLFLVNILSKHQCFRS